MIGDKKMTTTRRKNLKKGFVLLSLLILIIVIAFPIIQFIATTAKTNIYLESVDAKYVIDKDGSATVTEVWDICFNQESPINTISKSIAVEKNLVDDITLISITEPERNTEYIKSSGLSKTRGTFFQKNELAKVDFEWYGDFAKGDRRTFEVVYKIKNAVALCEDIAEFNWEIMPKSLGISVEKFNATITIPLESVIGDIKDGKSNWEYITPEHNVNLGEPVVDTKFGKFTNSVYISEREIRPNTSIETRIIMKKDVFTGGRKATEYNKDEIIARNNTDREKAENVLLMRTIWRIADMVLFVIMLIVFAIIFRKMNRRSCRFGLEQESKYIKDPPSKLSLGALEQLYHFYGNNDSTNVIMAAVLSLANKGHIRIEKEQQFKNKMEILITPTSYNIRESADEIELLMLSLIMNAGNNHTVSIEGLKQYARTHRKDTAEILNLMETRSEEMFEELNYADSSLAKKKKSYKIMALVVGIASAGIFVASLLLNNVLYHVGLGGIILGAMVCLLTAKFARLTEQGEQEYSNWRAFGRYMKNLSLVETENLLGAEETTKIEVWEQYLVYAVAMGTITGDKADVISQIRKTYPHINDPIYWETNRPYSYLWLIGAGSTYPPILTLKEGLGDVKKIITPQLDDVIETWKIVETEDLA